MNLGKNIKEISDDGIGLSIINCKIFEQKEELVSMECEVNCDTILYDVIINIMGPFENLLDSNPFLEPINNRVFTSRILIRNITLDL